MKMKTFFSQLIKNINTILKPIRGEWFEVIFGTIFGIVFLILSLVLTKDQIDEETAESIQFLTPNNNILTDLIIEEIGKSTKSIDIIMQNAGFSQKLTAFFEYLHDASKRNVKVRFISPVNTSILTPYSFETVVCSNRTVFGAGIISSLIIFDMKDVLYFGRSFNLTNSPALLFRSAPSISTDIMSFFQYGWFEFQNKLTFPWSHDLFVYNNANYAHNITNSNNEELGSYFFIQTSTVPAPRRETINSGLNYIFNTPSIDIMTTSFDFDNGTLLFSEFVQLFYNLHTKYSNNPNFKIRFILLKEENEESLKFYNNSLRWLASLSWINNFSAKILKDNQKIPFSNLILTKSTFAISSCPFSHKIYGDSFGIIPVGTNTKVINEMKEIFQNAWNSAEEFNTKENFDIVWPDGHVIFD